VAASRKKKKQLKRKLCFFEPRFKSLGECRGFLTFGASPQTRKRKTTIIAGHRLMFLLVGLGNPGPKYEKNRHNIGFMAVDEIARQFNFGAERIRLQGLAREGLIETETGLQKAIIVKPQTFMNESGRCVGGFMTFHKIPLAKVIVYYDEVELAPGRCRVKVGGGTAGHNGLRSIVGQSGAGFKRVRLGVGHPGREKMLSHVLDDFSAAERGWVDPLCNAVARCTAMLLEDKHDAFQTKVSTLAPAPPIPAWLRGGDNKEA
jgi:peptidyl-tRNA hydrolase, PTH1 family